MTPGAEQQRTTLYRAFDENGALLYVGISLRVMERLLQHRHTSGWFTSMASMTFEWFDSRDLAENAERQAIQTERPLFNIEHTTTVPTTRVHTRQQTENVPVSLHSLGYMTEKEVAVLLGVKRLTLRNWRSLGKGPPFHKPQSRLVLYARRDVESWLRSRTAGKESAPTMVHGSARQNPLRAVK